MKRTEVKILPDVIHLKVWLENLSGSLVVTNGCFDILHRGHIDYLEEAACLGNHLLVGINDDESVKTLKGPSRPINCQYDRARILAGLSCVDAVYIFHETRADQFLAQVRPNVWVKGGDYSMDTLDPNEVKVVQAAGGKIRIIPTVPGYSTTDVISKIGNE